MRKSLLITAIFIGSLGISYGAEGLSEIQPVSLQLIEPVEIQQIPYLEAPKQVLTEEKIKELKEKEALPSMEDIQAKEENEKETERKTQAAVTDVISEEEYNSADVIEFVPEKKTNENIVKTKKIKPKTISPDDIDNFFAPLQINAGSIYKY